MSLMFDDRASLYLAQYVVRQHAQDNRDDHPLAKAIILLQVCVDSEAIKAREELREPLGKAGFKMRSGCSSRPELPCMKA